MCNKNLDKLNLLNIFVCRNKLHTVKHIFEKLKSFDLLYVIVYFVCVKINITRTVKLHNKNSEETVFSSNCAVFLLRMWSYHSQRFVCNYCALYMRKLDKMRLSI